MMITLSLSLREMEVLDLISQEMTNPEIAEKLFLSTHTVVSHRRRLLSKLNARNSVGLIKRAYQFGLIQIPLRAARRELSSGNELCSKEVSVLFNEYFPN